MAIKCPKCSAVQEQTMQCKYCGTDFEISRASQPNPFFQAPVVAELLRIAKKIKHFPEFVKDHVLTNTDRLSAKIGIDLRSVFRSIYKVVRVWCRDVLDLLMTIMVCGVLAWTICVLIQSVAEGFWSLYLATEVGKQFLVHFPWRAGMIHRIINYPPLFFPFTICVIAVKSCLVVAVAARVLYVFRFFYENRPVSLKVIIWTPVCAVVGAWFIYEEYYLFYQAGFALMLIPVLFLFHPCFELAIRCLPEANLIWIYRQVRRRIAKVWRKARPYLINRPPKKYY